MKFVSINRILYIISGTAVSLLAVSSKHDQVSVKLTLTPIRAVYSFKCAVLYCCNRKHYHIHPQFYQLQSNTHCW